MTKTDDGTRLIFFIFFLSGISALIYEVVWLRILIRIFGCTVYATSIVLGAFMAGLALGSYFWGRYADRASHHLRVYAFLEFGIGLSAMVLFYVFDLLVPLYRWIYAMTSGQIFTFIRVSLVFICLVVPTTLMGGTLPILSSFLARERSKFGDRIGLLYGINTMGAVFGVLGSGFVFLGILGEFKTILIGVAGNISAGIIAYTLDRKRVSFQPGYMLFEKTASRESLEESKVSPYSTRVRQLVCVTFALSGFIALGYEVIWTRILQLFLKTSIYAFSGMLSIYLTGIAIGSLWGRKFVDHIKDPIYLFAVLEIFIAFFSVLGLSLLFSFDTKFFKYIFGSFYNIMAACVLIFPITICLGVIFPTVIRCFTKDKESAGQAIGQIYSVNIIGCILGSLVCGFLFLPLLGSMRTILFLAGINLLMGIVLLMTNLQWFRQPLKLAVIIGGLALTILTASIVQDPYYKIVKHRIQGMFHDNGVIYLHRESVAATITAFGSKLETNPLYKHLWLNGAGMTHLVTEAKLIAHLPILLCEDPKDVLIVCFGMGTTLKSAIVHDNLNVDVVELVSDTYDAFKFFHHEGPKILQNPRVHYYVNDGRNFLLMSEKLYDVITIDPAPPIYSAGAVNLYSQEFISLCRKHLTPEGVVCLWIPPASYTETQMIMRTFQSVFPHTLVWRGPRIPGFYLTGSHQPLGTPIARFRQAFKDHKFLVDINEWDYLVSSGEDMMNLLLLNDIELAEYLEDVPIITDNYPYTEFPLWRWILDPDDQKMYSALNVLRWKVENKEYSK